MTASKIQLTEEDYNNLVSESSSKFNSTMLDIMRERSKRINPSSLVKNYESKNSLFKPSKVDPRIYNEISNKFFDAVSDDYECIELSPINPYGLNSTLTNTNQNNVMTALRSSEVVSDSSISMALECAYRTKKEKKYDNDLASSTRLLRTQNYGNGKKNHWTQHFRACSLASSYRNISDNMIKTLNKQINNWIKAINSIKINVDIINIEVSICFLPLVEEIYNYYNIDYDDLLKNSVNPDYNVFTKYGINLPEYIFSDKQISNTSEKDYLMSIRNTLIYFKENVFDVLKEKYPTINFDLQLSRKSGLNYYDNLCYEINAEFKDGRNLTLVDGGITDWTGKLLSDSKLKCTTSGMGLEYLGKVYKRK